MVFDAKEHKERLRIITHGRTLLPKEKNITILYEVGCKDLKIEHKELNTAVANHLPTPEESARENPQSKFSIICPKCSNKSYVINALCKSCKDSEDGKYKTMFKCYECGNQEKSKEPMVVWLQRLGIDFGTQSKKSLGIKTTTDEGEK